MKKETSIILPIEASIKLSIKSQQDLLEATKILSVLNKTFDYLTEQKEKLTKPLNSALKEIRSRYKEPEEKLQIKIDEIRGLMTKYQTEQMALQVKKEEKIVEKLASGEISIEKATNSLEKISKVPTKTETDEGSIKFKPVKKFQVQDLSQVPLEYHLANESMIRSDMNNGKEISGVKYWVEQVPYNSR